MHLKRVTDLLHRVMLDVLINEGPEGLSLRLG